MMMMTMTTPPWDFFDHCVIPLVKKMKEVGVFAEQGNVAD
jgi:hypothetical protein